MYNHEPSGYDCPFCHIAKGNEKKTHQSHQADIFYRDPYITAFISTVFWPNNPGNCLIISNKHFENLYDIPEKYLTKISNLSKKVAVAYKKALHCDGVSTRQHNEPGGSQEVWHYHLQVFPRYENDNFYVNYKNRRPSTPKERRTYADKLKKYLIHV
jgi:histidine triad (HIT) family protein